MKLDRNINPSRTGKYALVLMRVMPAFWWTRTIGKEVTIPCEALDFGTANDFFVIRLKDKYAAPALLAYSLAAREDDPEWADEVFRLAEKAASHPHKQKPD
jgi:hypothetical protein